MTIAAGLVPTILIQIKLTAQHNPYHLPLSTQDCFAAALAQLVRAQHSSFPPISDAKRKIFGLIMLPHSNTNNPNEGLIDVTSVNSVLDEDIATGAQGKRSNVEIPCI